MSGEYGKGGPNGCVIALALVIAVVALFPLFLAIR